MSEEANMRLGSYLRMIRERKGLKQGKVGQDVGMDQSSISNIENGRREAPESILVLARYYGIKPPYKIFAFWDEETREEIERDIEEQRVSVELPEILIDNLDERRKIEEYISDRAALAELNALAEDERIIEARKDLKNKRLRKGNDRNQKAV